MNKINTLPDELSQVSLKRLLSAYGHIIRKDPARWLSGLRFAPEELAEYPTLARALSPANILVVNFAPPAQVEKKAQAA